MVQGGALVGKDIPPYVIVRNDTLRFAGINKIGLSRRGFTPQRIGEIHDACRILFQSGLNYLAGCEEVERQIPQSDDRDALLQFIRSSQRGIIKPYAADAEKHSLHGFSKKVLVSSEINPIFALSKDECTQ